MAKDVDEAALPRQEVGVRQRCAGWLAPDEQFSSDVPFFVGDELVVRVVAVDAGQVGCVETGQLELVVWGGVFGPPLDRLHAEEKTRDVDARSLARPGHDLLIGREDVYVKRGRLAGFDKVEGELDFAVLHEPKEGVPDLRVLGWADG